MTNDINKRIGVRQFMPPPPYRFDITDKKSPYYQEVKMIEEKGDSLSKEEAWIAGG